MSISVFSAPSGGYQTIPSNAPRQERTLPLPSRHAVGNTCGVVALVVVALAVVLILGRDLHWSLDMGLLLTAMFLALVKVAAAMSSSAAAEEGDRICLAVAAEGAKTRAALDRSIEAIASEQAAVTKTVRCIEARLQRVSEIADLPEILNERAAKHARLFLAEVQELREAVDGRLGMLKQRVDEQECRIQERDEEYERGWVDGAAKTADALSGNSNGRVHQLRPR